MNITSMNNSLLQFNKHAEYIFPFVYIFYKFRMQLQLSIFHNFILLSSVDIDIIKSLLLYIECAKFVMYLIWAFSHNFL